MLKNKYVLLLLFVLSLPILLPVFNPGWKLGWIGMILGGIGTFVSPVVIFGVLGYGVWKAFQE